MDQITSGLEKGDMHPLGDAVSDLFHSSAAATPAARAAHVPEASGNSDSATTNLPDLQLTNTALAAGQPLTAQLVQDAGQAADAEGVSGRMYDIAESALLSSWKYGAQMIAVLAPAS